MSQKFTKKMARYRAALLAMGGIFLMIAELQIATGDIFLMVWNVGWGCFIIGQWFSMMCRAGTDEIRDSLSDLQHAIVKEAIKVLERQKEHDDGADWWKKHE